jgi:hypothetical protein
MISFEGSEQSVRQEKISDQQKRLVKKKPLLGDTEGLAGGSVADPAGTSHGGSDVCQ